MPRKRSAVWWEVWNRRHPELVDLNGFESHFTETASYLSFLANEAAFIRRVLRLNTADRLLDLGCGTGILASLLAPHVRSILALDYSEHALETARAARGGQR